MLNELDEVVKLIKSNNDRFEKIIADIKDLNDRYSEIQELNNRCAELKYRIVSLEEKVQLDYRSY